MRLTKWIFAGSFFLCCCFSATVFAQQTPPNAPVDPYKPVLDRLQSLTTMPLPEWRFHADVPHPEDPNLADAEWQIVKAGNEWETGSRVLRRWIEIPDKINGYSTEGARVDLNLVIRGHDALILAIFSNGNIVYRGDEDMQQPIPLTQSAKPGQKFLVAVRIDCATSKTGISESALTITPPSSRPDPSLFRMEVLSAQPVIGAYEDGKVERIRQLDAAVAAVDFSMLDRGDQGGFDRSLNDAQSKLAVLKPWLQQFTIHAVGNSHIDMAWLWPWTETVEVVRNTFQSVLDLMREYPDFKFAMSSARTYEWIEEKYPDMFKQIQQRVKEGRWEVVGGMWVEPDLNMPDGESLTRQIFFGKRYFQQKFGVNINIGWNPDSFGYNTQLPQIYKRSGIDYFVTQKLLWASEFTKFPYRLFWWQAPDGSKLLTYFPSDYANAIDPQKMARDASVYSPMMWNYNGGTNSAPKQGLDTMYLFGVGDHGGGPTRVDLDTALRWQKNDLIYPQLSFSTAAEYFAGLEKNKSDLKIPTWEGELYFQYHRGVQTTQSEEKKGNRKNEVLMLDAEKVASIETLFGADYPQQSLDDAWKNVLFNQFHDILPGSGIHINYVDAARRYAESERINRGVIQSGLTDIAERVNSAGVGVLVFNPLSWARTDQIEVEAQFPGPVRNVTATDPGGKELLTQILSNDAQTNRIKLRILVENIPATGYELIRLIPNTAVKEKPKTAGVIATENSLENDFVKLKVDSKTGCITSLIDKASNKEALAAPVQSEGSPAATPDGLPCGNLLQAFVDKPKRWDAWNVDADFVKQHTDLLDADEVKLIEHTPLRAVIRVKHHWQSSTFIQDITMEAG